MLKALTLAVALLGPTVAASAADFPVKAAPKLTFAYPYDGSGFYFGGGISAETLRAQIVAAPGGASAFAAGGSVNGVVGYSLAMGPNRWVAVEAIGSYATTSGDLSCGGIACSFSSRLSATQKLKYGGDISTVTGFIPDLFGGFPTLPVVPGTANNPLIHPYIGAYLRESQDAANIGAVGLKKWTVAGGLTTGVLTKLKDGWVVDTFAEVDLTGGSTLNMAPGIIADPKTKFRLGLNLYFGVSK